MKLKGRKVYLPYTRRSLCVMLVLSILGVALLGCSLYTGQHAVRLRRFNIPVSVYAIWNTKGHWHKIQASTLASKQDRNNNLGVGYTNNSDLVEKRKGNMTLDSCREKTYLVYYCDNTAYCGGLGDRQRAIVGIYLTSVLLGREFAIMMKRPCPLETFMDPNEYDWLKCNHALGSTPKHSKVVTNTKYEKGFVKELLSNRTHKERVIFLDTDRITQEEIRNHSNAARSLPWMMSLPRGQVMGHVLRKLFKPKARLKQELKSFETNIRHKRRLVCAHIRMSNNPSLPTDAVREKPNVTVVFQFLKDKCSRVNDMIFVATDSEDVKNRTKIFFGDRAVVSPRAIVHVDQFKKSAPEQACEGLFTALYEQAILSTCDVLLVTKGGFAQTAAFIRSRRKNLFCYSFENNVIYPCILGL